jgi:hypothetical protein
MADSGRPHRRLVRPSRPAAGDTRWSTVVIVSWTFGWRSRGWVAGIPASADPTFQSRGAGQLDVPRPILSCSMLRKLRRVSKLSAIS